MSSKLLKFFKKYRELMATVMPYSEASIIAKSRDITCRGCNHDGSEYRLETHHCNKKAYGPQGTYGPCKPSDLTTFCVQCHDLHTNNDRMVRYSNKDTLFVQTSGTLPQLSKPIEKAQIIPPELTGNRPNLSPPLKRRV